MSPDEEAGGCWVGRGSDLELCLLIKGCLGCLRSPHPEAGSCGWNLDVPAPS